MKKTILLIFVGMFLISFACAADSYFCCEKTKDGAWCQNALESKCNPLYQTLPTSCEQTSYCQLGCCYNGDEGTCLENTPEQVCTNGGGIWSGDADCAIPQCNLGCCLIGDQAAFVTKVRCKKLSSMYGLNVDFRTDVTDEISCIASTREDAKGACVFENADFEKDCKFTTKKECDAMINSGEGESEFYEGLLCTNEKLGTKCNRDKTKTTCVDGKDEVYFMDTCGNVANIYDSSKIEGNQDYWDKVYSKSESCGYGSNTNSQIAGSARCGNCDYYSGTTCQSYKQAKKNTPTLGRPNIGDNFCADLSCVYNGQRYEHGESWCASNANTEDLKSAPGARDFRLICYNGEVTIEPCADYKQAICIEQEAREGFTNAMCKVNKWQDCVAQTTREECEDINMRDCVWIGGRVDEVFGEKLGCAPSNPPGLDYASGVEATQICGIATEIIQNKCTKGFGEDWECSPINNMIDLERLKEEKGYTCTLMGDCGNKKNYLGILGKSLGFNVTMGMDENTPTASE